LAFSCEISIFLCDNAFVFYIHLYFRQKLHQTAIKDFPNPSAALSSCVMIPFVCVQWYTYSTTFSFVDFNLNADIDLHFGSGRKVNQTAIKNIIILFRICRLVSCLFSCLTFAIVQWYTIRNCYIFCLNLLGYIPLCGLPTQYRRFIHYKTLKD
jgi:hypothetical protein